MTTTAQLIDHLTTHGLTLHEPPAQCVPDAAAFWKLQERVDALEKRPMTAPNFSRLFSALALAVGLVLGFAISGVAVVAAWVMS